MSRKTTRKKKLVILPINLEQTGVYLARSRVQVAKNAAMYKNQAQAHECTHVKTR
jgi:hypothetical protein